MIESEMIYLFVVNEFSLLRLMVFAILRRKILILMVEPVFPGLNRYLESIVNYLISSGRAQWAFDAAPELKRVQDTGIKSLLYDVYGKTEPWQNAYFQFPKFEQTIGHYAMACKLAITNYMEKKHGSLLVLRALLAGRKGGPLMAVGIPADSHAAAEIFSGASVPGKILKIPTTLINFLIFSLATGASVLWAIGHTRLRKPEQKTIFLAADFIADARDFRLYEEMKDGGELLMVGRGVGIHSPLLAQLPKHTYCHLGDGQMSITEFVPLLKMVVQDEWALFKNFSKVHPGLFRCLVTLPYKRLKYRCLFKRFMPQYYWGRDPYNDDHIIRRQELQKVGGTSLGVNTGALTWAILIPAYRYISYDRFYVFGQSKLKKYYGETWARDMEVIPAGSFTAHREYYDRRFDDRPNDIVIFTGVFLGEPEFVDFIRGLAETFVERKIIIQTKGRYQNRGVFDKFIEDCQKGLSNIEYSTNSAYELFFRARYGISDPSSMVVEAMQFGMITFAFDIPNLQTTNVNREYPGLTVTDVAQVVENINKIENESWEYPREAYQELVDMSGTVFFDRVRVDAGLPSNQTGKPVSLLSANVITTS